MAANDNICWFNQGAGFICGKPAVKQVTFRLDNGERACSSFCAEHANVMEGDKK